MTPMAESETLRLDAVGCAVGCAKAIGDIIHGPMLAHKAEDEGAIVAEYLGTENFGGSHGWYQYLLIISRTRL